MTLVFEDANSELLYVVSVADVDAEECVDNSLVEILKLKFGRDLVLLCKRTQLSGPLCLWYCF